MKKLLTEPYPVNAAPVSAPAPTAPASVEEMAAFLTDGFWGGRQYTFSTSTITVNLDALTFAGRQLARWAMEAWEMVSALDFVEVGSGEMITVDDAQSGAFAYAPGTGSTASEVEMNISTNWLSVSGTSLDSYSFQTYVHEFGHAIGLGHQGHYDGFASYGVNNTFANDSWQMSVMSYFSQTDNTATDASYGYAAGPMMVDIYAIQSLYGAPGAAGVTAGDTVFGQGSSLGNYLDPLFDWFATGTPSALVTGNDMAFTLYDQGGTDRLDLGFLGAGEHANIDMNGGAFSDIGAQISVFAVALGTVIETLSLGAGNDTVMGNGADNLIQSGQGNDSVTGAAGDDTVVAGAGDDTVWGWGGDDQLGAVSGCNQLYGGDGNDTVTGGTGVDIVGGGAGDDWVWGGDGDDFVWGGDGDDTIGGDDGNDLVGGATGDDCLYGALGKDTLWGGSGDDCLSGADGADVLWAADGDDTVDGGLGDDEMGGGGGRDRLVGDQGNDTLWGSWGADTLWGGEGDDLLGGGDQDDLLTGAGGSDTLLGSWGRDTLNGGWGADQATGGPGADHFVFLDDWGADTITDFTAADGDRLLLDDALWGGGGLTGAQVISQYADTSTGTVLFDFGDGTVITLLGVGALTGLDSVLDIL